jgi:predicted Zn-dependent peptidase
VENIREDKGYTYSPRSSIDHATLGSSFSLSADVATEVTAPAVLETWHELGRMATLPVKDGELESVRQYAIGTLALSTATQAGLASTLSGLFGNGLDVEWLAGHPARLSAVTVDQVAEVAAEFLAPSRLVGVAVGDASVIAEPLSRLTAVEVSSGD